MSKIIGIDLGTTNSVVSFIEAEGREGYEHVVITNPEGSRTTPSVVGFSKSGERLVGQLAKRQAVSNPDRTIASIKRHMGEKDYKVTIDGKSYTPQEISAMILQKLKADAEAYLGETVTEAVITVPAYFNDGQRQATTDAGKIAGLNVRRIINEPTAAAYAYGVGKEGEKEHTVLVFDLGGGTFDVSILDIDTVDGDGFFQVRSTNGDTHLGGDDFDRKIFDWIVEKFKKENGVDLSADKMSAQRVLEAAEKAKIELSNMTTTNINLPFITANANGPLHLDISLSRSQFDELTSDLVERTMVPTRKAMDDAGLKPEDIDKIIMVGGSSRIPAVQEAVRRYLGKEPFKGINPDECVSVGAAIQGGLISGAVKGIATIDVTPLSLGIETMGGVFTTIIERNTAIPTTGKQTFSTAADNQSSVDVHVLQGERPMAADNKTLGRFILSDIPPAPRGIPQIEVTFDIDVNGIVNVSAKDLGTGKQQNITIQSDSGISKEDIDRMVKEAAAHAEEDKKKKEAVDVRNNAESLVHSAEKTIKDFGEKADPAKVEEVKAEIEKVNEALKGSDVDAIKSAMEALQKPLYELSAAAYKNAQEQQEPASQPSEDNKQDSDVVDGEAEVVDDKK